MRCQRTRRNGKTWHVSKCIARFRLLAYTLLCSRWTCSSSMRKSKNKNPRSENEEETGEHERTSNESSGTTRTKGNRKQRARGPLEIKDSLPTTRKQQLQASDKKAKAPHEQSNMCLLHQAKEDLHCQHAQQRSRTTKKNTWMFAK